MEELERRVSQLEAELRESHSQKEQAAKFGLALLEEKAKLEEELEKLRLCVKDGDKSTTPAAADSGLVDNESCETADEPANEDDPVEQNGLAGDRPTSTSEKSRQHFYELEATYSRIAQLEGLLTDSQDRMLKLQEDNAHLKSLNLELSQQLHDVDAARKQLKHEVSDLKSRETQNLNEFGELEEENIGLQKQLLHLRQQMVTLEPLTMENRRLHDEVVDLTNQLNDVSRLKHVLERNLEESIERLQQEREQKRALRRQLDQRLEESPMPLHHYGKLAQSFRADWTAKEREVVADIMEDAMADGSQSARPSTGNDSTLQIVSRARSCHAVVDLSAEMDLERRLVEMQERLDAVAGIVRAALLLHSAENVSGNGGTEPATEHAQRADDQTVEFRYDALLRQVRQVDSIVSPMNDSRVFSTDCDKLILELRSDFEKWRSRHSQTSDAANDARRSSAGQVKLEQQRLAELDSTLSHVGNEMVSFAKQLLVIYQALCNVSEQTPSKLITDQLGEFGIDLAQLEKLQTDQVADLASPSRNAEGDGSLSYEEMTAGDDAEHDITVEMPGRQLPGMPVTPGRFDGETTALDPAMVNRLSVVVQDQVKYLKRAVVAVFEQQERLKQNSQAATKASATQGEVEELQEQLRRHKALLMTKREQIGMLRNLLKGNKSTAEAALARLKQKYEIEKQIVQETMTRMKHELLCLKEEATQFAHTRSILAQRCDEYANEVEELYNKVMNCEEEKKTLNSLLRMAIQQKLALTQRLDSLQYEQEVRTIRGQMSSGSGSGSGHGSQTHKTNKSSKYGKGKLYQ